MKLMPYWKIVASLIMIALCSGLIGAVVAVRVQNHRAAHQINLGWIGAGALNRLEQTLQLTPDQREKVKPLLENARGEMQNVVVEALVQAVQMRKRLREEIRPLLTPEQRAILDQATERRERWLERRQNGDRLLPEWREQLRLKLHDRLNERTNPISVRPAN